jgi:CDP-diacylglycerol--serine O-phosphatidyltransferase
MFSLKDKNFSIKDNLIQYIFLGISLILLIILWIKEFNLIIGVPIIIIIYIFISIINAIIKKFKK